MNRWDQGGDWCTVSTFSNSLLGKVPVYHLSCDISEDAVKTLEQEIGTGSFEE